VRRRLGDAKRRRRIPRTDVAQTGSRLGAVGDWYTIGLFAGLGLALGVLLAGLLASSRPGLAVATVVAAVAAVAGGLALADLGEAVASGLGSAAGALGAAQLVRGAVVRGGTRAGTALLVGLGALVLAALAFVPIVGYLEAVAVPALASRLRRRAGSRYAGLRILARD
jgi:hypothetical protein